MRVTLLSCQILIPPAVTMLRIHLASARYIGRVKVKECVGLLYILLL